MRINATALLCLIRCMSLLMMVVAAGCSQRSEEDWYVRTVEESTAEQNFVDVHRSLGVSEADAKSAFYARKFAEATEGRDKKFVWDKRDIETGTPPREMPR